MISFIQRKVIDSYDSCGPKGELLLHLSNYFDSLVPIRFGEAKKAIDSGDVKKLKFDLHALKNSFLNVGALSVAEECQTVEDEVENKSAPDLYMDLGELRAKYTIVKKELVYILEERKAGKSGFDF